MSRTSTKALVTSCDVRFLDGAEALLRSVARFHPDVVRYCFVPARERGDIEARLDTLATVLPPPRAIKGVPAENQINVGRLFAVHPAEEVSAYMDADVLMCRPAPELWELEKGKVNAVPDAATRVSDAVAPQDRETFERHFPGAAGKKGFNAGVFALAPREWRDLPERFEASLAAGAYTYSYILDQPLLNALIQPNVNWLPFEFNAHCLFDNPIPRNVRIVHFTSSPKPWMRAFRAHDPAYAYWLRYGLPQAGVARRCLAALWIAACTPKRLLGRRCRRLLARP